MISLLGVAAAWNAGNVAPVASDISSAFDMSLVTYGLLTGTSFFIGNIIALAVAPRVGEWLGVLLALRVACLATFVGNIVIAITPVAGGVLVGRLVAAVSFAFVAALAPVYARHIGGVLLLGIFGASVQLGIGLGIGVGSVLSDVGFDWRVGFFVSAAVGAVALVSLHGISVANEPLRRTGGFLRAAFRTLRVYRLSLLFISIYGVPVVMGAWLTQYLVDSGGVRVGIAGALAFVLFASSALMRFTGARLQQRGVGHLTLVSLLGLSIGGVILLVIESSVTLAIPAVIALGAGFALPYAKMLVDGQKLFPSEPAEPLALLTIVAMAMPIAVIPLVGLALDRGEGRLAFAAIGVFLAIALIANLRPTGIPVTGSTANVGVRPDG
jgi:MFS family permease